MLYARDTPAQGAPSTYPSGISPPPAMISDIDKSGIIAILAGFSMGLVLMSAGIRLYAKRYSGDYRYDDYAFYIAAVFAIIQTALVLDQIANGLGKQVDNLKGDQLSAIQKSLLASDLFYIIVLFLSKASCAFMFLWLSPWKTHKRLAWVLLAASGIWLVTSLFIEGFRCDRFGPVTRIKSCAGFFARWLYISIFDILIEVALVSMSLLIVWNRQMARIAKYTIVGAFACRLPNVALTVTRLVFLSEPLTDSSSDSWIARVSSVTEIAVAYTVTACVFPYLRPLVQAYERDGSNRGSGEASFKLSERASRGSWSAAEKGHSKAVRVDSKSDDKYRSSSLGNKNYIRASDPNAVDEITAPVRGGMDAMKRSGGGTEDARGWFIHKAVDWGVSHDHKPSVAVPPDQKPGEAASPGESSKARQEWI